MALLEIDANPDADKRRKVHALLPDPADIIANTERVFARAARLESRGLKPADAIHVAAAELNGADALLTCDDRLVRTAGRLEVAVRVMNPLVWLQEQRDA